MSTYPQNRAARGVGHIVDRRREVAQIAAEEVIPMNEEQYAAIREELAANQKEHESYNRRLREHDEKLEKQGEILLLLERLTNTVQNLTNNMGEVKTTLQGMNTRLDTIEKEPGDKWKKASWEILKYVLLAIAAGVVGYIVKR